MNTMNIMELGGEAWQSAIENLIDKLGLNSFDDWRTAQQYAIDHELEFDLNGNLVNHFEAQTDKSQCFYFDGDDPELLRELIKEYGSSSTMFFGANSEGEKMTISIDAEQGIITNTYQNNGWVRVNYYSVNGNPDGETFDGRWTSTPVTSEAQRKAIKKYKQKVNRMAIEFSPAEAELWERIQQQEKKQTYIKALIRADIEKEEA